jgi:hypothetical protein
LLSKYEGTIMRYLYTEKQMHLLSSEDIFNATIYIPEGKKPRWRILPRRFSGLAIEDRGVTYHNALFSLTIPWWNLAYHNPFSCDGDTLRCRLRDTTIGRGFIINKTSLDEKAFDDSVYCDIDGDTITLPSSFSLAGEDVCALLLHRYAYMQDKGLLPSPQRRGTALCIKHYDPARKTVAIDTAAERIYPSFCPFTGDDASVFLDINSEDDSGMVTWFASKHASSRRRWRCLLRYLSGIGALAAFCLYGYNTLESTMDSIDIMKRLMIATTFLCVVPVTWWWLRDPFVVVTCGSDDDAVIYTSDDDYLQAFVSLNS